MMVMRVEAGEGEVHVVVVVKGWVESLFVAGAVMAHLQYSSKPSDSLTFVQLWGSKGEEQEVLVGSVFSHSVRLCFPRWN
jgi:hypothetical protein